MHVAPHSPIFDATSTKFWSMCPSGGSNFAQFVSEKAVRLARALETMEPLKGLRRQTRHNDPRVRRSPRGRRTYAPMAKHGQTGLDMLGGPRRNASTFLKMSLVSTKSTCVSFGLSWADPTQHPPSRVAHGQIQQTQPSLVEHGHIGPDASKVLRAAARALRCASGCSCSQVAQSAASGVAGAAPEGTGPPGE